MGDPRGFRKHAYAALALVMGAVPQSAVAVDRMAVDPDLVVHSVTLSRSSVAVSGLNVVPVQVRVSATYDPARAEVPLSVVFERTAPGGTLRQLFASNLSRISGPGASGVWGGAVQVPSTAGGRFKVKAVVAGIDSPGSPIMADPTPFDGPELSVTGLHQPRITATTYPNPVPPGSAFALGGKVIDSDTGQPYPTRVAVEIGVDNTCAEYGGDMIRSTTAGTFAHRLPSPVADMLTCAQLKNGGTYIEGVSVIPRRPGELGARSSVTSGSMGTLVTVDGRAKNARLCPAELQRLRGATQWRQVSLSRVRQSGRITLLAPLSEEGTPVFRVYLPRCRNHADAATAPFAITPS